MKTDKLKEIQEDIDHLFSKINWGASFLDGKAAAIMNELKSSIVEAVKEQELTDRFFLEEIVHRLENSNMEYVEILTRDWLDEMVEKNPMSFGERRNYIENIIGQDKEFSASAYFKSETSLKRFLDGKTPIDLYPRLSDATGEGMDEGYLFNDGEYLCETEEEAKAYVEKLGHNWEEEKATIDTDEEWFYWTAWEELDEDTNYDSEGNEYVKCHKCHLWTVVSETSDLCEHCLTNL